MIASIEGATGVDRSMIWTSLTTAASCPRGHRRVLERSGRLHGARRKRSPTPGHPDAGVLNVAPPARAHAPDRSISLHDGGTFGRRLATFDRKAHQPLERAMLLKVDQRPAPEKIRLVQLDDPGQACRVGCREGIRVLADDEVLLLEAQDSLGFEAEGGDAEVVARLHQLVPEVHAVGARRMDLVTQLAHEADAQDEDRDA